MVKYNVTVVHCLGKIKLYLIDKLHSRAYDRAAIKFRGLDADINFNLSDYEEDLKQVIMEIDICRC